MIKRTTLNIDLDLTRQAAAVLGTSRTTDTVHRSMEEVVARERRRRLAARELSDLTPGAVEEMRAPRPGR